MQSRVLDSIERAYNLSRPSEHPAPGGLRNTLLRATVVTLAIWGLLDILVHAFHQASTFFHVEPSLDLPPCWCGSSNEEAVAMGCIYDHIAVDWLPPHCHDAALVAEFDASGPVQPNSTWDYYRAAPGGLPDTQVVRIEGDSTIDALARDGEEYWATVEWHVAHCLFTWRKQVRFWHGTTGVSVVEPWNAGEAHAQHCSAYIWDVMKNGRSLDEISTMIPGKARHENE